MQNYKLKKITLFFILLNFCTVLFANDWEQWRGPVSDGISSETGILKKWPNRGPKQVWRIPLGAGYSGIVVSEGLVYTIYGTRGDEYCIALNEKTGKKVWRTYLSSIFRNGFGDGPRSTPTVDEGKVYAISGQGIINCLDAKTGDKIWGQDLLRKYSASNVTWGFSSSPYIYDGMLVCNVGGTGHGIIALDKSNGKLIWRSTNDKGAYSTAVSAKIGGKEQLIFFTAKGIVSVIPKNGKVLWRYGWKTAHDVNAATPIVQGDYVFLSSGYNSGAALIKISKRGGSYSVKEVWKTREMKNHFSSSIFYEGHFYGFNNTRLVCMDFKKGKTQWSQAGFNKGSLLGIDGHMIVLGERGKLALVELNPNEYREKSKTSIFPRTKCWTVPTVANGRLFARNEQEMVCLDITGK